MRLSNDMLFTNYEHLSFVPKAWFRHEPRLYESEYPIRGKCVNQIIADMAFERAMADRSARSHDARQRDVARDVRFRQQKYFGQPCQHCHDEVAKARGMCNRCYQQMRRE